MKVLKMVSGHSNWHANAGIRWLLRSSADIHCNILAEQRRPAACLALAEEALRFSREHFLVFWAAGLNMIGWLGPRLDDGSPLAGIEQLRTGIESWKNTGAALHLPTWSARLAEALLLADATDQAATVLEDALALAHKNGDVFMLAELHRLRGRTPRSTFAELPKRRQSSFEPARWDGSKRRSYSNFALRIDLAQLWVDHGDVDKAASLLTPVFELLHRGAGYSGSPTSAASARTSFEALICRYLARPSEWSCLQ